MQFPPTSGVPCLVFFGMKTDVLGILMCKVFDGSSYLIKHFSSSKTTYQRLIYIFWRGTVHNSIKQAEYADLGPSHIELRILSDQIESFYFFLQHLILKYHKSKHFRWFLEMKECKQILTYFLDQADVYRAKCEHNGDCIKHNVMDIFCFYFIKSMKKNGSKPVFKAFRMNHSALFERISAVFFRDIYGRQQLEMEKKGIGFFGIYSKRLMIEKGKIFIQCGNPQCGRTYFEWKYGMKYYDDMSSSKYKKPLLIANKYHDCVWNKPQINQWHICGGCKALYFCSRRCQKKSWNRFNHKAQCLKLQKLHP